MLSKCKAECWCTWKTNSPPLEHRQPHHTIPRTGYRPQSALSRWYLYSEFKHKDQNTTWITNDPPYINKPRLYAITVMVPPLVTSRTTTLTSIVHFDPFTWTTTLYYILGQKECPSLWWLEFWYLGSRRRRVALSSLYIVTSSHLIAALCGKNTLCANVRFVTFTSFRAVLAGEFLPLERLATMRMTRSVHEDTLPRSKRFQRNQSQMMSFATGNRWTTSE